MEHKVTFLAIITQDIYTIYTKTMYLNYDKFINLGQQARKCENVMLETLSGTFNAILRVTR